MHQHHSLFFNSILIISAIFQSLVLITKKDSGDSTCINTTASSPARSSLTVACLLTISPFSPNLPITSCKACSSTDRPSSVLSLIESSVAWCRTDMWLEMELNIDPSIVISPSCLWSLISTAKSSLLNMSNSFISSIKLNLSSSVCSSCHSATSNSCSSLVIFSSNSFLDFDNLCILSSSLCSSCEVSLPSTTSSMRWHLSMWYSSLSTLSW